MACNSTCSFIRRHMKCAKRWIIWMRGNIIHTHTQKNTPTKSGWQKRTKQRLTPNHSRLGFFCVQVYFEAKLFSIFFPSCCCFLSFCFYQLITYSFVIVGSIFPENLKWEKPRMNWSGRTAEAAFKRAATCFNSV